MKALLLAASPSSGSCVRFFLFAGICCVFFAGCSSQPHRVIVPPPALYSLGVTSTSPANQVSIKVSPLDGQNAGTVVTPFRRSYASGATVTLSAPDSSASGVFESWTGCDSANSTTCVVTVTANKGVIAHYKPVQVSISQAPSTLTIGQSFQLTATVQGAPPAAQGIKWSLAPPADWKGDSGTITNATSKDSENGLYTTPYPAPTSVFVLATSTAYPAASTSIQIFLHAPPPARGPDLSVDTGGTGHPINPLIYGMNFYSLDPVAEKNSGMTVDRFGGDATSRYNYLLDATSAGDDWYFENQTGKTGLQETGQFNAQVLGDKAAAVKTMATVDVLGWVAKDRTSCSFPISVFSGQSVEDPYAKYREKDRHCGNGKTTDTKNITGNHPTDTSIAVGPSFAGDWVRYLVGKFGDAASGGVAMYSLDNEPAWWDAVHRDVHPVASTYDEVTQNGIATAKAVKTADPTASVTGPVVDFWWNYFYSKKDIESGWSSGAPCHKPWSNPVDRTAHQGVPFVEWYLQQMKQAESTFGARLLDYLDLHTYYAGTYRGKDIGLTVAGDTAAQQIRLNSTRVFWDPTYTDTGTPQPNYITDANFTANCNTPLQPPLLIPMMKGWIARDYPGTKTAITEYNWGGQENVNGAVAQADLLGIFGREGLDLATLWGPPDPVKQMPGLMAFEAFRNYDGEGSKFGDIALPSSSANQEQLAVYGARRTSDGALTIIVLNKTYGDLTCMLALHNLANSGPATTFRYSNDNLAAIVPEPDVAFVSDGSSKRTANTESTFPAQSITIFIVPGK